jgi:hypothetical protein
MNGKQGAKRSLQQDARASQRFAPTMPWPKKTPLARSVNGAEGRKMTFPEAPDESAMIGPNRHIFLSADDPGRLTCL